MIIIRSVTVISYIHTFIQKTAPTRSAGLLYNNNRNGLHSFSRSIPKRIHYITSFGCLFNVAVIPLSGGQGITSKHNGVAVVVPVIKKIGVGGVGLPGFDGGKGVKKQAHEYLLVAVKFRLDRECNSCYGTTKKYQFGGACQIQGQLINTNIQTYHFIFQFGTHFSISAGYVYLFIYILPQK